MRTLLSFRMTIAEWMGLGILLGVPYLLLGVVWSLANADRFGDVHGSQYALALAAAVLAWPVLLLPGVCVA